MQDKNELIEIISKLPAQDLNRMYERALFNKNWAIVKILCETDNPNKPPQAHKATIIEEAIKKERWEDVFAIQKEFQRGHVLLVQGPNLKSPWTYQLEDLFRKITSNAQFTVKSDSGNTLFTFPDGSSYNWSEIRKNANFQEISLEKSDYDLYRNYMKKPMNGCNLDPKKEEQYRSALYEDYRKNGQPIPEPPITFEEMQAINVYTTETFRSMNGVLRGTFEPTTDSHNARNAIIQSVMCAHGLMKIPQTFLDETYRGSGAEQLSEQISAAASQDVIKLDGFVSSSTSNDSQYVSGCPVKLQIKNLVGVYIGPISHYPKEKEFLLPPTAIQITNYRQAYDGKHVFEASCVSELACLSAKGLEKYIDDKSMDREDKFPFMLEKFELKLSSSVKKNDFEGYAQARQLYRSLAKNYSELKSNQINHEEFEKNCDTAIDRASSLLKSSKWSNFIISVKTLLNSKLPYLFDPPVKTPQTIMNTFKNAIHECAQQKLSEPENIAEENLSQGDNAIPVSRPS